MDFRQLPKPENAVAEVFEGDTIPQTDALWLPDKRYLWKGLAFGRRVKGYFRYAMHVLVYALLFGYVPALLFAPVEIADTQTWKEMRDVMKGLYPWIVLCTISGAIIEPVVGHLSRPDSENQI